jgi:Fe-S-cluster-containing dehydrogenase component/Ni/Fe-hydrogenase subunit HybB-like protein
VTWNGLVGIMCAPMQYGFLLDHHRCIGCHACTVACKAENDVPLASFRTWVKYTEKGRFPAVKRHFAVLRCNHCTKPPCVTICPVNALSKRTDGIVDLDRDACIGCRACMQACPYDAIYLNEDSGAAEKCHFCAHRVEKGLQPACVIVCPENAIIAGDLHDPQSRISRMLAENETLVRRPEQQTSPNVHYKGVLPEALQPGLAERPEMYLWSERPPSKPEPWPEDVATAPDVRTVLDAGHEVQWGWHVALYLVTKGIAAGAALLAPFLAGFGLTGFAEEWLPELVALFFLLLTTWLLVDDLARPQYFLRLLTRPNTKSWLVRGGWILTAFGAVTSAILGARLLGMERLADTLRWVNLPLGLATAGYTAFLFAQCEGRDLWQERALLPHLCVQALFLGAGALMPFAPRGSELMRWFGVGLVLHAIFVTLELRKQHATENARQAAGFLRIVQLGPIARPHQLGTSLGTAGPLALVLLAVPASMQPAAPLLLGLAALLAAAGLYGYKYAYVRAGQLPPLS